MAQNFDTLNQQCETSIEHFKKELQRTRTGRASTGLLEGLMVDYYGSATPLIQLGMIHAPEPRMLTIQVYDINAAESIEKAIRQSELGLNPSRDKNLIRVTVPSLTEERRKELVKKLHKQAEEARVSIRTHRRESIDHLKKREKEKELSSDDLHRAMDEVQKITDRFVSEIDSLLEKKEQEILEV